MKLSYALLGAFVLPAIAIPSSPFGYPKKDRQDYELVGYAKDNPIGPTTGGQDGDFGSTCYVSTPEALTEAVEGSEPKTIYVHGQLNLTSRLRPGSNKSIIGLGRDALITGQGISVVNQDNVIIRNLAIKFIVDDDGITLQNTTRVWVDHCEFESEFTQELGPDYYDGQLDIVRASDWITVSWNYFHDHWKSSLVGNSDVLREVDEGTLHITYHHNFWQNEGTRGPSGRFGHQHIYNNLYEDFRYQAIQSRSDNQVLVEGNVFRGDTRTALTTWGLVIPEDSPNTSPDGDFEIDGFANLGAKNDFGDAIVNITQVGNFTEAPYKYKLTSLKRVPDVVQRGAGVGKI